MSFKPDYRMIDTEVLKECLKEMDKGTTFGEICYSDIFTLINLCVVPNVTIPEYAQDNDDSFAKSRFSRVMNRNNVKNVKVDIIPDKTGGVSNEKVLRFQELLNNKFIGEKK